jgi:hypothetical protein
MCLFLIILYDMLVKVPICIWVFLKINCTEIMDLLIYCDSLMNIYSC